MLSWRYGAAAGYSRHHFKSKTVYLNLKKISHTNNEFFFFALSLAGLEFDTYIHTGEHKVAK